MKMRYLLPAFILLALSGCGQDGDPLALITENSETQASSVISERTLHLNGNLITPDQITMLLLEPAGQDLGSDEGEAGVDRLTTTFSSSQSLDFSIVPGTYEARLLDPLDNQVLLLNSVQTEGQVTVSQGTYTWEFRNLGTESILLFARVQGTVLTPNGAGLNLSGLDFSGQDMSGRDFSNAQLRFASFMEADCRNTNFSGCDLSRAAFSLANCDGANFSGANLSDVHSIGASATGATFSARDFQAQSLHFPLSVQTYSPPSVLVRASTPLTLRGGTANYATLTLEDGALVRVTSDTSLHLQSLNLLGQARFELVGAQGASGARGDDGADGTPASLPQSGGQGGEGKDGEGTPVLVVSVSAVSGNGPLNVVVQPGHGGNGGQGGDGGSNTDGAGANGGDGGTGGRGGHSENITFYVPSGISASIVGDIKVGAAGAGGAGGAGGSGTTQNGVPGANGATGEAGNIGNFSILSF